MLNKLIPHIDISITELNQFVNIYGLAERIKESQDSNAKEYPALFVGNDNYEQINLDTPMCYHRMRDARNISILGNDNVWGCSDAFEMTYPMVFVGCINHSPGCEVYESDSMANSVAFKLQQVTFDKALRKDIKVFDAKLFISSINTDKDSVWDEEYRNVENPITFNKIYFSVKYDLKIQADSSCLNVINC